MLQIVAPKDPFDAIVVGSGATGGWAAKRLTEAGMRVCLLEAGKKITPKDFTEHKQSWQVPFLGYSPKVKQDRPIQGLCYACREYNSDWFVSDRENPYTQAKPFHWIRQRVLGGRSLSWGRQSYRMSDLDFKAASHDGYGDDWPISYDEMVPYYEIVERYVGISGQAEGLPQLPDSVFQPPMEMTCGEEILKDAVKKKFGRTITIGRVAILTKPHNGRAACHYCGPCEQGCSTFSYFSSPWTTIADAAKTGRLTLQTDAVASHVVMKDGKAAGIAYIDRVTREPREVRAKIVMLCASTLESTRLLLNSGICNSSDALGKHVMDHIYEGGAHGIMPQIEAKPWAGPPRRPNGIYVPRFRNVREKSTNGFIRGYGYQGGSSPQFSADAPGFGKSYKEAVRVGLWRINLGVWAECLARKENYVEIDRDRVDAWGIPVLKVHADWSDNEKKLWEDAREQAAEMIEAAGAKRRAKGRPPLRAGLLHPRSRHRAHGKRRVRERGQQILPGARRAQYFRDRWRVLGFERLPESHAHHDGDHGARLRLHYPRICQTDCLTVRVEKLAAALACALALRAETHRFEPQTYYRTFSHTNAVAARIRPGDVVITKTLDAGGQDEKDAKRSEPSNPLTGPFFVEGAEPGDALLVHFRKVRLNRNWGWSAWRLGLFALTPEYVEKIYSNDYKADLVRKNSSTLVPWDIDLARGTTKLREPVSNRIPLEFPVRPMLGCVGVAAPGDFAPTSAPSGNYGGNLDYNQIGEGATVILPVFHPGGLLFIGDGHALMADGEPTDPRASKLPWTWNFPLRCVKAPE